MNTRPQFASRIPLTDLPPQIYYVHPLALHGMEDWKEAFAHARDLGFDTVLSGPLYQRGDASAIFTTQSFERLDPALGLGDDPEEAIAALAAIAKKHKLKFMLDLVVDQIAMERPDTLRRAADPRLKPQQMGARKIDFLTEARHIEGWRKRLVLLAGLGVAGFRCIGIGRVAPETWHDLIAHTRRTRPETIFVAWTPGSAFADRRALKGVGMDGSFSSLAWWDMEERWIMDEYQIQRDLGYQIAFPEAPFGKRIAHGTDGCEVLKRKAVRALKLASTFTSGLMIPMGFEYGVALPLDPLYGDGRGLRGLKDQGSYDLSAEIREINEAPNKTAAGFARRPLKLVSASQGPVVGLFQTDEEDSRASEKMRVLLLNRDLRKSAAAPFNVLREAASPFLPLVAPEDETSTLR